MFGVVFEGFLLVFSVSILFILSCFRLKAVLLKENAFLFEKKEFSLPTSRGKYFLRNETLEFFRSLNLEGRFKNSRGGLLCRR
jgi:hypothetical protein